MSEFSRSPLQPKHYCLYMRVVLRYLPVIVVRYPLRPASLKENSLNCPNLSKSGFYQIDIQSYWVTQCAELFVKFQSHAANFAISLAAYGLGCFGYLCRDMPRYMNCIFCG